MASILKFPASTRAVQRSEAKQAYYDLEPALLTDRELTVIMIDVLLEMDKRGQGIRDVLIRDSNDRMWSMHEIVNFAMKKLDGIFRKVRP